MGLPSAMTGLWPSVAYAFRTVVHISSNIRTGYGSQLPKLVIARNYSFPKSLIVPCTWVYAPKALSLSDAVKQRVPTRRRKNKESLVTHQHGSGINYPNQPERSPRSILSDPLTYWWGVTLCPPELNDVSLAESVVIHMRYAAIKEMYLNTEVQKPSLEDILEFQGPRIDFTVHTSSRCQSIFVIIRGRQGDARL